MKCRRWEPIQVVILPWCGVASGSSPFPPLGKRGRALGELYPTTERPLHLMGWGSSPTQLTMTAHSLLLLLLASNVLGDPDSQGR